MLIVIKYVCQSDNNIQDLLISSHLRMILRTVRDISMGILCHDALFLSYGSC